MKLIDLIEDRQHTTTNSEKNYSGKLIQSEDAFNDPKSGGFASVKDDKKDPHMVKKYHHGPLDDDDPEMGRDAYVQFALWITEKNINNPFLPRIYDIKKIKDRDGKYIYRYQIEKLISGMDIGPKTLWKVLDRYFVRSNEFDAISKRVEDRSYNTTHDSPKFLIRLMGLMCEHYILGEKDNIKDDSLKEALDYIREFIKEYNSKGTELSLDLENSGNIMFRRGPYGLQMVITDPVA